MSVLTVNIEGFGDLPVGPGFGPTSRFDRRGSGEVQSVTDVWEFSGVLPAAAGETAVDLEAKRAALIAVFEGQFGAITINANSTEIDKIGPVTHVNGAFFEDFSVELGGGEWVNLLEYQFTVTGKRGLVIPDVHTFERIFTFDEEIQDDGTRKTTTTKTVRAEGPGARLFVEAEKPSNARFSSITENETDQIVEGQFTIPDEDERTVEDLRVDERISVESGIFPPEFVRATRTDKPNRFLSSKLETIVSIEGTISGKFGDKRPIVPISEDFSEALSARPRIQRRTPPRSDNASEPERALTIEYSLQFSFAETISSDEVVADRQSFKSSDFRTSGAPTTEAGKAADKLGLSIKSSSSGGPISTVGRLI